MRAYPFIGIWRKNGIITPALLFPAPFQASVQYVFVARSSALTLVLTAPCLAGLLLNGVQAYTTKQNVHDDINNHHTTAGAGQLFPGPAHNAITIYTFIGLLLYALPVFYIVRPIDFAPAAARKTFWLYKGCRT